MSSVGNNAIVTDKYTLQKTPIVPNRYLVAEDSRELYYDSDRNERFKLRDVQILEFDADRSLAKAFTNDLYFIKETLTFWFYDSVNGWNKTYNGLDNGQLNIGKSVISYDYDEEYLEINFVEEVAESNSAQVGDALFTYSEDAETSDAALTLSFL